MNRAPDRVARRQFSFLDSGRRAIPHDFRRKAWFITIGLWLVQYLILTLRASLDGYGTLDLLVTRAEWCGIGILICITLYLMIERLWNLRFIYQAVIALAAAVPTGLAFSFINALLYHDTWRLGVPHHVQMGSYWLWFFFAWTAIILALNYSLRAAQEQKDRVDAQVLAHNAQLRALRYQLNPHFLFNTLNSIAALSLDGKPEIAEAMLVKLSAFLRSGLATDPLEEVRLADEIVQQQLYFDIERLRYPDRLVVNIDIPESLQDALVPSFILQPLVENAIKHGVSPSKSMTIVAVSARDDDGMLTLRVEDDSKAASQGEGVGVGLSNVETRLAAQYGTRFWFRSGRREQSGFFAEMSFPLRYA